MSNGSNGTPRTTLRMVAQAAGVSITTASMVLNKAKRYERISPACADRVQEAARRLDYAGNYHFRAIRKGRAETLGLAVATFGVDDHKASGGGTTFYHNDILAGVEQAATHRGCSVLLIRHTGGRTCLEDGTRAIRENRIDAMVIEGGLTYFSDADALRGLEDLPIAVIEPRHPTVLPSIVYDEAACMRMAVEHLAGLGHRRLLWLGWTEAQDNREQHYRNAVRGAGLHGEVCRAERSSRDNASEGAIQCATAALATRLGETPGFTAVVSYNDIVALGALRALRAAGQRVPQDISVIGVDDAEACLADPPLTTVSRRFFELGRRAGELALQLSDGTPALWRKMRGHREVVPPELVLRDSTGRAPVAG